MAPRNLIQTPIYGELGVKLSSLHGVSLDRASPLNGTYSCDAQWNVHPGDIC